MAVLPRSTDLSGPASLRSGAVISSADMTPIGQGIAALGAGLQQVANERKQQQNALDITRAEAFKTENFLKTQNEFENDGDYATFNKRAPERTNKIVTDAANLIRDPVMRERFLAGSLGDAARVNDSIFDRGNTIRKQAETVALDEALETNRRIYVDPATPEEAKNKARRDIEAAIGVARDIGLLTPDQADIRKRNFIDQADVNRGELEIRANPDVVREHVISPDIPREAAALLDTIAATESPGYNVLNGGERFSDFSDHPRRVGRGGRATAAGRYQFVQATWDRAKAAAGVPDFSPASQDKAAWWLAQADYKERTGRDLLADLKENSPARMAEIRRALTPTWEGLKSLDDGKFSQRVAAGPRSNPDWFQRLSPEDRFKMLNLAEKERDARNVDLRAGIEIAALNAPASILQNGRYEGQMPSIDQFVGAYGAQDGLAKHDAFTRSVETAQTAFDMQTKSAGEIASIVESASRIGAGETAAADQRRYEILSKAADTVLKSREADPATYVRRNFPNVEQAWQGANTPEGMQAAIAASIAAQTQIGVRNIQPLPAMAAKTVVETFKNETLGEEDRVGAVTSALFATSDPGQRRAIFNQMVAEGLPEITEGAFAAMERGGDPGAARRLMQAALIDPSKLPGQAPFKESEIDAQIQADLMDDGLIGDVYYGLTDGLVENPLRASRDNQLLINAVTLRTRRGEPLSKAVQGAAKDLYGDVKVVTGNGGVNAKLLMPSDEDETPVLEGLERMMPQVEAALTARLAAPGVTVSDGPAAVVAGSTGNYIANVLSEGYFRNVDGGFVFIDPYAVGAIANPEGQPIIFTIDDVLSAPSPGMRGRVGRQAPAPTFNPSQDRPQR